MSDGCRCRFLLVEIENAEITIMNYFYKFFVSPTAWKVLVIKNVPLGTSQTMYAVRSIQAGRASCADTTLYRKRIRLIDWKIIMYSRTITKRLN